MKLSANERARLRFMLLDAQGCLCGLCGKFMGDVSDQTFDHIIPRSLGGWDAVANIRLVHRACNEKRGNRLNATDRRLVSEISAARRASA